MRSKTVLAAIKCGCLLISLRVRLSGGPLTPLHSHGCGIEPSSSCSPKPNLSVFFQSLSPAPGHEPVRNWRFFVHSSVPAEPSLDRNLRISISLGYSLIGCVAALAMFTFTIESCCVVNGRFVREEPLSLSASSQQQMPFVVVA